MTSKEFEEKVIELGYKYDYEVDELDKGEVYEYICNSKGELVSTHTLYTYEIDTSYREFMCLPDEEKDKIVKLMYEYIKTPIEDRKIEAIKKTKTVEYYDVLRG